MTRLSYRRYTAHFLLSLSAIYLSHLIFEGNYNTLLILVIFIASLISEVGLISASPHLRNIALQHQSYSYRNTGSQNSSGDT
jgi:uncharacterized membrane protein YjjP (DUF1212 family)